MVKISDYLECEISAKCVQLLGDISVQDMADDYAEIIEQLFCEAYIDED